MRYTLAYQLVRIYFGILGICISVSLFAQSGQGDIISLTDFVALLQKEYPLYKAAQLQAEIGEAKVLEKRGAFDPKIASSYNQKHYSQSNYYRVFQSAVTWQSPFGVRLSTGVDWSDGIYLNPKLTYPQSGLTHIGLEVPVLRGLLFDEFRAELRDANLFQEQQLLKGTLMRNMILAEGVSSYLELVRAQENYEQFRNAETIARDRFEFVRSTYLQGDFPAIDTLEAFMQVQQRQLQVRMAANDLLKAKAMIAAFLPALAEQEWSPQPFSEIWLQWPMRDSIYWMESLQNQPELRTLQVKQERLTVERKLIQQQFLPQLDVKYQWLNSVDALTGNEANPNFSPNDMSWGFKFSYPIPLRKVRGQRELNRLKQLENGFKIQQKSQSLTAKVDVLWQVQENYQTIISDYSQLVQNYQRLLEAEQIQFELGESSVFLLNSRENKLIDARLKFIELQVKSIQNFIDLGALTGDMETHFNW